jgi:hypothetical protein
MGSDRTIGDYLDELRDHIHVKLFHIGGVGDPNTLQLVCLAIGMRVADPYNLRSLIAPPPSHVDLHTQNMLAAVDKLFAEEIAELRDVIADAQEDPAWHASIEEGKERGEIPADQSPLEAIAKTILLLFLGFDDEVGERNPEKQKGGEE